MNNLNDKYHLVYNFKDHFYLFELDPSGNLYYKVFDVDMKLINKHTIFNNNVMKFNIALDNDRVILTYLLKTGELYLRIYDGKSWTEAQIGRFDTRSNLYHQMEVLYFNNKINIIYSYSNYINSEIISIHHLVLDKKIEEQNNVIKYVLRKNYNEFTVAFDQMATIHLIYNTRTNFESYIYHSFYSPYRGAWSSNPKELSTRGKDNSSPYLFIDSKSNINTCWLELGNNKYKLRYAKMPINGRNKYIWENINIPVSFNNKFTPLIYEEDESLNILCYDSNSITILKSNDYGKTWINKGDKQASNIMQFIRLSATNEIHPNITIKDILVKGPNISDLNDLYLNLTSKAVSSEKNIVSPQKFSENISPKYKDEEDTIVSSNINEETVVEEESNSIFLDEYKLRKLINEILEEDRRALKDILENEKVILSEIDELKKTIAQEKPSLFNKFFR